MLDIHLLFDNPAALLTPLLRRGVPKETVQELTGRAETRRQAIKHLDGLREQLNAASEQVQKKAKSGDVAAVDAARLALRELKVTIKLAEEAQTQAEQALHDLLLTVPNAPHASVPDGLTETDNRVERQIGTPRKIAFKPKSHWELVEGLGIVDFEQASKMSGARFAVYRGAGARLERAITAFMLDVARENGYLEMAVPLLVRSEAMLGAGQYPKFVGESFETLDHEFVLIPTSEVPLVNLHRDEILESARLPLRYTAFTPCFRREAGAAGKDTRGLIRQHQFNKVELVVYCTPEDSYAEHERLTASAEDVLRRLELPYRVMTLCTADLGFAAAKTYDLEVWLPGQDAYREISSCSNCEDFQARRARIRYRPHDDSKKAKPRLVHTLNGSATAVGRAFVAILENYQEADGSITVPQALVPYFGAERITGP